MRKIGFTALFTFLCFLPAFGEAQLCPNIDTQVLRVYCSKDSAYYHKPWKSPDFSNTRGSAFFFKDEINFPGASGLILTNAHAVSLAQSIRVSNGKEKRQYKVKLVGICNTADFAVLKMEDEEIAVYERRNGPIIPLELGDSDKLRVGDKVMGWGYPLGGEGISKSEQGEISRIEVASYAHSHEQWLMVQASLQQNRGNSGGPVLKEDKVVGISFQGMRTTDRINYFIPINLVKRIIPLLDKQELIPRWRYKIQFMFPRLKDYYGLEPDQGGILLDRIIPDGGPYKFGLRDNDILTAIDAHDIDSYGEIFLDSLQQKVFFMEIINRKKVGDHLAINVIRDGAPMKVEGEVTQGLPRLVPKVFTKANYLIFSGIGLVELTLNSIENLDKIGAVFRAKYYDQFPKVPYQKIVVISEIFPEYGLIESGSFLKRVTKLNGKEIINIVHLYGLIEDLKKSGAKKALLELTDKSRLPIDIENHSVIDSEVRTKYGILNMRTPGGFSY